MGRLPEYIHLHPNSILHKVRGDIPAEVAVMFNPLGAGCGGPFTWAGWGWATRC